MQKPIELLKSHPTNATQRNNFSTFVFLFQKIADKHYNNIIFHIVFPWEGNFDNDAGNGDGGDDLGPPKIQQKKRKIHRTIFSHF